MEETERKVWVNHIVISSSIKSRSSLKSTAVEAGVSCPYHYQNTMQQCDADSLRKDIMFILK